MRYLYMRRHDEDKNIVPYNPEIAILFGCSSQFSNSIVLYLISKPEPSLKIELPEKCNGPQRCLRIHVVGSVEVLDMLLGFHKNQMSRQVMSLQTDLNPWQRMLKP